MMPSRLITAAPVPAVSMMGSGRLPVRTLAEYRELFCPVMLDRLADALTSFCIPEQLLAPLWIWLSHASMSLTFSRINASVVIKLSLHYYSAFGLE